MKSQNSASVGMRYPLPANSPSPKRAPASKACSSASVYCRITPLPSVVRSTVRSWQSTGTPSRVMWTSVSSASTPSRSAYSKLSIVFSGRSARAPRCPSIRQRSEWRKISSARSPASAICLKYSSFHSYIRIAPLPAARRRVFLSIFYGSPPAFVKTEDRHFLQNMKSGSRSLF